MPAFSLSRLRETIRQRPLRSALVAGSVVILCLAISAILLSISARGAKNDLELVAVNAQLLETSLSEGDQKASTKNLAALQESTENAKDQTNGWLWRLAGRTPLIGKNLSAVRISAAVLNDIANEGLDPLIEASGTPSLQNFSPSDGRLDLKALAELSNAISQTQRVTDSGEARMKDIDGDALLPSVAGPVREVQKKVFTTAETVRSARTALTLLPPMLGSKTPRKYLAIFQNNAEVRSTGGLPGAYAIVRVDKGKIRLGKQGTGSSFGELPRDALRLTADERRIYKNKMARFFTDTNFTPDFQRTAQLASAMLEQKTGEKVDGVISMDPVALSYVLAGTGPITLDGGRTVYNNNAVDVLLNQVYFDIKDPEAQDDFFADSASKIFDAVADGKGNPEVVMSGILRGALEHRVYVWSKDKKEEEILQDVRIGGALTPRVRNSPNVGIFLNDGTGAKMQYYLNFSSAVSSVGCDADGRQEFAARVKLISNAPADAGGLPGSVTGPGYGTKNGSMTMNLRFYAPLNGRFGGATINDRVVPIEAQNHDGRPVATVALQLKPLERKSVTVKMFSGPGQEKKATVAVTPGIQTGKRLAVSASSCGD